MSILNYEFCEAYILTRGTSYNKLEPSRIIWDQLEHAEMRCSYQRLALEKGHLVSIVVVRCSHGSDKKF